MDNDVQTHAIIGAAFEVHRELGHGFLEMVYHEALSLEFIGRHIPFEKEVQLPVFYKNQQLSCFYRADFICYDEIIVELKAISTLTSVDHAQLLNYLKATGCKRGLLLNFGSSSLQVKRLVF
jgi:GxxExxY protein